MKVIKPAHGAINQDFIFLLSSEDVGLLEHTVLNGEAYIEDYGKTSSATFPYALLEEKIALKVDACPRATSYGARSDVMYRNFCIIPLLYERLKKNGCVRGARHDNLGNTLDIINYEAEIDWNFQISSILRYLKLR